MVDTVIAGICCQYCRLGFYSENAMFVSDKLILECAVKELTLAALV